jgi:glycerol-3-phosphate acyltransferase PlsY
LIGDVLKGVAAIGLARLFNLPDLAVIGAGLAVIAGHNWSIFLKFRAGRGVATGLGVALALTWQPTLVLIVVWGIIILVTRYVSVASIVSVALYPVIVYFLKLPSPYVIMGVIGAAVIIWQHRDNVKRLMRGEESKLGNREQGTGNEEKKSEE